MPASTASQLAPVASPQQQRRGRSSGPGPASARGFGAGARTGSTGGRGRRRRGSGLSAADRSPLGRSPDLAALRARARLGLPLAGRLGEAEVNRAWKGAAGEHHPDRGGLHDTMQAINAARDLLLGRGNDS